MKKFQFGFIGCGNMGGTLAAKVIEQIGGKAVAVCDADQGKTMRFAKEGATVLAIDELARQCRFVVLGVKPQVIVKVIESIRGYIDADTVIVSMAAGVSVSAVKEAFQCDPDVIRIMPNTPATVGEGTILYTVQAKNNAASIEQDFVSAFAGCGKLIAIDEGKIDAGSAVSGCGPAFAYMFVEALADAGVECGLAYNDALAFAAQTVLGAAKMVQTYGSPATLRANVCSPGGTTIAGVHALEEKGFRAATMDAVVSAYKRTLELKK